MKLAGIALHLLVAACAVVLSGSGLSSHASPPSGTPPPPAVTDAIATDLSDYMWPTDAGSIVTSTFAEFRSMHFHGGVDVSTGDVTGYRVFAMRDGYVSRILIFTAGYGKMLFVKHHDGYTSTYAHLSRFAPAIEALARAEQMRRECYPIDLELKPGDVQVSKGSVIAYTGDTGIGTPHLHFEIRDQNLEPINPQLCADLLAPDAIPPVIHRIAVTPLGEGSLVQGGWDTQVYAAHEVGHSRYRVRETITISGNAGFAVSARDRTEGSRFQRGLYRYILSIDGAPFSTTTLNRAPMRDAHAIGLYFDWNLLDRGLGRFEKLYPDVPGTLPFFSPAGGKGVGNATLSDGPHQFVIAAEDIAGNRAEVSGTIVVARAPDFSLEAAGTDLRLRFPDPAGLERVAVSIRHTGGIWSAPLTFPRPPGDAHTMMVPLPSGTYDVVRVTAEDSWGNRSHPGFVFVHKPAGTASLSLTHVIEPDFIRVIARTSGVFTSPPAVAVYEGHDRRIIPMAASEVDLYVGTFRPSPSVGGLRRVAAEAEINGRASSAFEEIEFYPIVPGKTGSYALDGGRLRVRYDSLSVYRTILLQVEKHLEDGETVYSLLPAQAVLREGLDVSLAAPPAAPNQGLYFLGRNSREFLSPRPDKPGGAFTGRVTRTLGDVSIMVDNMPPSISRLFVRADRSRRLDFSFRAGDNLSGIEYEAMKAYIDGHVVIPEVDGEHHRVFYRSSDPLERGSHRLLIRLSDRAGNINTLERRFTVR
jgi:hypothetical protein